MARSASRPLTFDADNMTWKHCTGYVVPLALFALPHLYAWKANVYAELSSRVWYTRMSDKFGMPDAGPMLFHATVAHLWTMSLAIVFAYRTLRKMIIDPLNRRQALLHDQPVCGWVYRHGAVLSLYVCSVGVTAMFLTSLLNANNEFTSVMMASAWQRLYNGYVWFCFVCRSQVFVFSMIGAFMSFGFCCLYSTVDEVACVLSVVQMLYMFYVFGLSLQLIMNEPLERELSTEELEARYKYKS